MTNYTQVAAETLTKGDHFSENAGVANRVHAFQSVQTFIAAFLARRLTLPSMV